MSAIILFLRVQPKLLFLLITCGFMWKTLCSRLYLNKKQKEKIVSKDIDLFKCLVYTSPHVTDI